MRETPKSTLCEIESAVIRHILPLYQKYGLTAANRIDMDNHILGILKLKAKVPALCMKDAK